MEPAKETNIQSKAMKKYKAEGNPAIIETMKRTNSSDREQEKQVMKTQKEEEQKSKKNEAVVNGKDLPISKKHAIAICNYIKGKEVDKAIEELNDVKNFKKAISMKGEIPHRKGNMMSGRYPVTAVKEFIRLLKSLRANAVINGLELEKNIIFCKADTAPRPYRRFGQTKFKRAHVTLKLILPVKKINNKEHNNGR